MLDFGKMKETMAMELSEKIVQEGCCMYRSSLKPSSGKKRQMWS